MKTTTCIEPTFQPRKVSFESIPFFKREQTVVFLGGTGTVKNCTPLLGTWLYSIEMELGPEPECGRLGDETTILLTESEISEEGLDE